MQFNSHVLLSFFAIVLLSGCGLSPSPIKSEKLLPYSDPVEFCGFPIGESDNFSVLVDENDPFTVMDSSNNVIVTGSKSGQIKVWDFVSMKPLYSFNVHEGDKEYSYDIASLGQHDMAGLLKLEKEKDYAKIFDLHIQNNLLVTVSHISLTGFVTKVWDLKSRKLLKTISHFQQDLELYDPMFNLPVIAMDNSSIYIGSQLISNSRVSDVIEIYDQTTLGKTATLTIYEKDYLDYTMIKKIVPGHNQLALLLHQFDNPIEIWDLQTKKKRNFAIENYEITDASFKDNDSIFIAAGGKGLLLFDIKTSKIIQGRRLKVNGPIKIVDKRIAFSSYDCFIEASLMDLKPIRSLKSEYDEILKFAVNDNRYLTLSYKGVITKWNNTLLCHDLETYSTELSKRKKIEKLRAYTFSKNTYRNPDRLINIFSGSPTNVGVNKNLIVGTNSKGEVIAGNIGSGERTAVWGNIGQHQQSFIGFSGNTAVIAKLNPGYPLYLSGKIENIFFWDTLTGKKIRTYHENFIQAIDIENNFLAYIAKPKGSGDAVLKIYDIPSSTLIHQQSLDDKEGGYFGLTIDSGKLIITTSNRLRIFDINTFKEIFSKSYDRDSLSGLTSDKGLFTFLRSDRYVVKYQIEIWDTNSLSTINTITIPHSAKLHINDGKLYLGYQYVDSNTPRGLINVYDARTAVMLEQLISDKMLCGMGVEKNFIYANRCDSYGINIWTPTLEYSDKPFEAIQKIVQVKVDNYLKPRKPIDIESQVPSQIPQPSLPPKPELIKDEFETTAMFLKRVEQELQKRQNKIDQMQKNFRYKVEQRNKKIEGLKREYAEDIEKIKAAQKDKRYYLEERIVRFTKEAFIQTMGQPYLQNVKYDADKATMYADLVASNAKFSKKVTIAIPLNEAKAFKENLSAVNPELQFKFGKTGISLNAINMKYLDKSYVAQLSSQAFTLPVVKVDLQDEKIAFKSEKQKSLTLQNPNLKDSYQVRAFEYLETGKQHNYKNDELPHLYDMAQSVPVDKSKWLFVIGVELYDGTDDVIFSQRSAKMFTKVAQKKFGIKKSHTFTAIGEKATAGSIKSKLKTLLKNVQKGDTIYFYYSGHGIPVIPDNEPYILPKDVFPDFVSDEKFFKLRNIYKTLSDTKAKKIIAFIDSCFSGATDDRSIIKGTAASRLKPKKVSFDTNRMVVLTAGKDKQYSNMFSDKGHRLFSYYLMKSLLEGRSDIKTLFNEVFVKVKDVSFEMGPLKVQEPTIEGNKEFQL